MKHLGLVLGDAAFMAVVGGVLAYRIRARRRAVHAARIGSRKMGDGNPRWAAPLQARSMEQDPVFAEVCFFMQREKGVRAEQITERTTLVGDLGWTVDEAEVFLLAFNRYFKLRGEGLHPAEPVAEDMAEQLRMSSWLVRASLISAGRDPLKVQGLKNLLAGDLVDAVRRGYWKDA